MRLRSGANGTMLPSKEDFVVIQPGAKSTLPYSCNVMWNGVTTTLSGGVGGWFWYADKLASGEYTFAVVYEVRLETSQTVGKMMKELTGINSQGSLVIGKIETAPIHFTIQNVGKD